MSDGTLSFDTKIDSSGFSQGASKLKSLATKAIAGIGIAISGKAIADTIINITKRSVELASDLQEVQNVVDVTFGDGADTINKWAKGASTAFGITELSALQYTGTMGAMLKSMGLSGDAVRQMSTDLTGLAGDFASFFNITSDEAFAKIRSGISGETEPLKQLGINMSVANMEAYAMAQGIDKAYSSMTQAEQATLRYNYLLSVSADAQGDFARTASTSFANASRITELNIQNIGAAIGKELIPAATRAQKAVGGFAADLAEAMNSGGIRGGVEYIKTEYPAATAVVSGLAAAYGSFAIIKTVVSSVNSLSAAQRTLTLWLEAGTAAELMEAGALTAKETILGVLTGKNTMASAAQALFNATVKANPYVAAAMAIGALVAGVVALQKAYVKANPALREAQKNTLALNRSMEDLAQTQKDSAAAYQSSIDDIESNALAAEKLVGKLKELSGGYTGTVNEQRLMQTICDELNGSVDGLNVSFDAQTGALNMSTDAMSDHIAKMKESARVTASMERYTQLLKEQAEAEYNLYIAERNRTAAQAAYSENDVGTWGTALKANEAWSQAKLAADDAAAAVADYEGYMADAGITAQSTAAAIEDTADALDASAEAAERVVLGGYDVTDVLESIGMSADEASERLDTFTDAATNMFEKINTKSDISVKDMIKNLRHNTQAMEDWGNNIAQLGGQLPSDLLQPLIDQGPEKMAGVMAELAKSTPEQLSALSQAFSDGGDAAAQAWLQSLGAVAETEENPVADAAEKIAADTRLTEAVEGQVTAATTALGTMEGNFTTIGAQAVQGLINGIASKSGALEGQMRALAAIMTRTFTVTLRIQSPSKVFRSYGAFISEGLADGIRSELDGVKHASLDAAAASQSGFTDAPYLTNTSAVRETKSTRSAAAATPAAPVVQNIYAQKQSPAQMLREAKFLQERAVLIGV